MKPKNLMLLGVLLALATFAMSVFTESGTISVLAFGGGALFGKGYGVWEERTKGTKDEH